MNFLMTASDVRRESEGEPSAAVDSVEGERSASLTMWKCTYADSYGYVDCFKLTLPCTGAARRGCLECLRHLHERMGAGWGTRLSRAAAGVKVGLECLKYLYENSVHGMQGHAVTPPAEAIWNVSNTYMKMGVLGTSGHTAQ